MLSASYRRRPNPANKVRPMNWSRPLYVAALLLLALLAPLPASGAAARQVTGSVDYRILMAPSPGQAIVLAALQLPETVRLPATVRIPVPPGMTVTWAGEISSGDPSKDRERPYVLRTGNGGKYAEFEVEEFRRAQIDLAGREISTGTALVSEQFDFVQSVPSGESGFSVRVPPGAHDVGVDPAATGEPQVGASGEAVYPLPARQLKPGETTRVSVSYRVRQAPADGADGAGGPRRILIGIAVAALLVIAALVVAVRGASRHG